MNKLLNFSFLSALLLSSLLVPFNNTSVLRNEQNDLVESATDLNRPGSSLKDVQIGLPEEVYVSETWAQYGQDEQGFYYLRFITALTGPVESVTYTRSSEKLGSLDYNVDVVYKGVQVEGHTWYYDGVDFGPYSYNSNWYFACYTIKYVEDTFKDEEISAYISVVSEKGSLHTSTPVSTSLNNLLPSDDTGPDVSDATECTLRFNNQTGLNIFSLYVFGVQEYYDNWEEVGTRYREGDVLPINLQYCLFMSNTDTGGKGVNVDVTLNGTSICTYSRLPWGSLFGFASSDLEVLFTPTAYGELVITLTLY